ncbi:MAG: GTPase Era [Actinomycetota bacterium]
MTEPSTSADAGADRPGADADADADAEGTPHRSGFVALTGRPNVGKSTLLNRIVETKVSIVSNRSQTTRHQVRGVVHRHGAQAVFVDTPGISKPRSALGHRLNESAAQARSDVDVVCLVLDAQSGVGRGDQFIMDGLDPATTIGVLNKIDGLAPEQVLAQLEAASQFDLAAYFPASAFTGRGVPALVDHVFSLLPEGPEWYPVDMVSDHSDAHWVAELVREQLLRVTRDEVPHSVATRVTEWAWPRIRVEILVERESQKGIVIGRGGKVLKDIGSRVRAQLPKGAFLELVVTVAPNWQSDRSAIEDLGY